MGKMTELERNAIIFT